MESRLTHLEEKLAHQEAALTALSDTVYAQQRELEALKARCQHLSDRVQTLQEQSGGSSPQGHEPPPHY
ncbi:SlyX family protein [Gammaproteobacteria bacterium AB-CW1]|uniref:SlyX family protein n=1 Tax=Natronospira elongata TaxID=3110268 RepID=A0AAP6JF64_9GAMM|nr:SlyX family protein [Gammaproteobacteria bacterium AB-CW1]